MFSNDLLTRFLYAIVTPSFAINGDRKIFLSTTFRPLGPNVTFTVSANLSTPA